MVQGVESDRSSLAHGVCRRCARPRVEHVLDMGGGGKGPKGRLCPDGSECRYQGHRPRHGASQSYSEEEVELLDAILSALRRGGDLRQYARHPAFPSVARKAAAMKASADKRRAEREG